MSKVPAEVEDIKSIFVILTLLIAFPIGLILMWRFTKWHVLTKISVTFLPIATILLLMAGAFRLGSLFG